jgi:hypothetical protein
MSKKNINDDNKQIVYLLYETNSAKKDYSDEMIGVFSTNNKVKDYKQKLEKNLDKPSYKANSI